MVIISRHQSTGYAVHRAVEPFRLEDLVESARANIARLGAYEVLGRPVLFDYRAVSLTRFDTEDFKQLIAAWVEMGGYRNTPAAMVAGSELDFGILRMYGAYREIAGLHEPGGYLITRDYDAAVAWISNVSMELNLSYG
ncbi:MAG: hypothetical protein AAGF44_12935 [Pseudomonadota bacterium]